MNNLAHDSVREVDIYDFDKTVFPVDSGSLFTAFAIATHPYAAVVLPYQAWGFFLCLIGRIDIGQMKKYAFSYLPLINTEKTVRRFWDLHERFVHEWARPENRKRYSVLISASPDFLMSDIAQRLKFDAVICTRHDKKGAVIGKNCHDKQKVRLFRKLFPDAEVECVYSDSFVHDVFIFSLGKKCFHIVKGRRIPFDFDKQFPGFDFDKAKTSFRR